MTDDTCGTCTIAVGQACDGGDTCFTGTTCDSTGSCGGGSVNCASPDVCHGAPATCSAGACSNAPPLTGPLCASGAGVCDAGVCELRDGGGVVDAGPPPGPDAGPDAGEDAGADGGTDAGLDAGPPMNGEGTINPFACGCSSGGVMLSFVALFTASLLRRGRGPRRERL